MNNVLNLKINMKVYLGLLASIVVGLVIAKYVVGFEDRTLIVAAIILGVAAVPFYRKLAGWHDDEEDQG